MNDDKWDGLWWVWRTKHLETLRKEFKVTEDYIEKNMQCLFKMLDEYTPKPCKEKQ